MTDGGYEADKVGSQHQAACDLIDRICPEHPAFSTCEAICNGEPRPLTETERATLSDAWMGLANRSIDNGDLAAAFSAALHSLKFRKSGYAWAIVATYMEACGHDEMGAICDKAGTWAEGPARSSAEDCTDRGSVPGREVGGFSR